MPLLGRVCPGNWGVWHAAKRSATNGSTTLRDRTDMVVSLGRGRVTRQRTGYPAGGRVTRPRSEFVPFRGLQGSVLECGSHVFAPRATTCTEDASLIHDVPALDTCSESVCFRGSIRPLPFPLSFPVFGGDRPSNEERLWTGFPTRTTSESTAGQAGLRWPPPGLERLQGDLWNVVRSGTIAALILVFPLLLSISLSQAFWSLGPLGSAWWVILITAGVGMGLILETFASLMRLLGRVSTAVGRGIPVAHRGPRGLRQTP